MGILYTGLEKRGTYFSVSTIYSFEQIKYKKFTNNYCWYKIMTTKTILVTGGAGYIGSHCVLALLEKL